MRSDKIEGKIKLRFSALLVMHDAKVAHASGGGELMACFGLLCWGRFLVEAAPASSRQYHGSCLPKAVKAECY